MLFDSSASHSWKIRFLRGYISIHLTHCAFGGFSWLRGVDSPSGRDEVGRGGRSGIWPPGKQRRTWEREAVLHLGSLAVSISVLKVADKTNNSGRGGREGEGDEVDIRDLERRAKMITM